MTRQQTSAIGPMAYYTLGRRSGGEFSYGPNQASLLHICGEGWNEIGANHDRLGMRKYGKLSTEGYLGSLLSDGYPPRTRV